MKKNIEIIKRRGRIKEGKIKKTIDACIMLFLFPGL